MASPSPAKSLKVWLIVILGIAAVCVVAMVLLYGQRQTGGMVQITQKRNRGGDLSPGPGHHPPCGQ